MNCTRNILGWMITMTIWTFGAVILWVIWQYQKTMADPAASFIEFTIMFVSTFYILALVPIKDIVDRVSTGSCELPDPILES